MTFSNRLFFVATFAGLAAGCGRAPQAPETSPLYLKSYLQTEVETVPPNAHRPVDETQYTKYPVESFRRVRLDEVRAEVLAAQKAGAAWANHPREIVQHFWPVGEEWRSYSLRVDNNELGLGTEMTITVMLYGLGDHLVAAEWDQFRFGRNDAKQPWQIQEWRKAYLSGENPQAYTASDNP